MATETPSGSDSSATPPGNSSATTDTAVGIDPTIIATVRAAVRQEVRAQLPVGAASPVVPASGGSSVGTSDAAAGTAAGTLPAVSGELSNILYIYVPPWTMLARHSSAMQPA